MSSYLADSNGKKKWANYESDSDKEEEPKATVEGDRDTDDDDDDDEDDELDGGDTELNLSSFAPSSSGAKPQQKVLSKREKQLAKQKELEDLDDILAEYRDLNLKEEPASEASHDVKEDDANTKLLTDSKIKRKKKKKQDKADVASSQNDARIETKITEPSSNVDIAAVLQARNAKKNSRTKAPDAQKIALEEALKATDKKKKKIDKSKFSEGSY
jgi:hypothetical protein